MVDMETEIKKKRHSNQEEIEIKCDFKSHDNLQIEIHSSNAPLQLVCLNTHYIVRSAIAEWRCDYDDDLFRNLHLCILKSSSIYSHYALRHDMHGVDVFVPDSVYSMEITGSNE